MQITESRKRRLSSVSQFTPVPSHRHLSDENWRTEKLADARHGQSCTESRELFPTYLPVVYIYISIPNNIHALHEDTISSIKPINSFLQYAV